MHPLFNPNSKLESPTPKAGPVFIGHWIRQHLPNSVILLVSSGQHEAWHIVVVPLGISTDDGVDISGFQGKKKRFSVKLENVLLEKSTCFEIFAFPTSPWNIILKFFRNPKLLMVSQCYDYRTYISFFGINSCSFSLNGHLAERTHRTRRRDH